MYKYHIYMLQTKPLNENCTAVLIALKETIPILGSTRLRYHVGVIAKKVKFNICFETSHGLLNVAAIALSTILQLMCNCIQA